MRFSRRFLFVICCGVFSSLLVAAAEKSSRLNIVLILADDLGWADLGCYGNRFNETPNIDRLATQGIRFTDFYAAAPVCSPTRASILSGQYQARFGLTAHIPGHWRPFEKLAEPPNALHMPLEITTVAEALRDAGYATAFFGKWHLGGKKFGPGQQGFDTAQEFQGHEIPAARQIPPGKNSRRSCDYIAETAERFMEEKKDHPFFIQISPFAVHIPLNTTAELQKKYEAKPKVDGYSCNPLYAGLTEELDSMVGRVMNAVNRLGLEKNTLFIFTSDNGGLERKSGGWPGTLNFPLRNEKGSLYEGGIRVPLIARWPGKINEKTVTHVPASTIDFYPTFLSVANTNPNGQILDGVNLLPMLKDPFATLKREALYWHYPHYHHSRPSGAVRAGDWKLIEFFDTGETELYDLHDDIGESKNLAKVFPAKQTRLLALLKSWRKEVDAQMPQQNPAYNPMRTNEWWDRGKIERTDAPGTYKN